MSLLESFRRMQRMCRYCKNENTFMSKSWDEKTKKWWKHRECSCGGKWIPRKETEENLQKHAEFLSDPRVSFK